MSSHPSGGDLPDPDPAAELASFRVPEGVDVNISGINTVMSDAKVDGLRPRPDGMILNLQGTVVMGDVKVLGPDVANPRKYEKFVR